MPRDNEAHENTKAVGTPTMDDMNIVIWGCTQCHDYGKVFASNSQKNFCGKCGGRLVVRNFTFPLRKVGSEIQ